MDEDEVAIIVRDDRPGKWWLSVIGHRLGVDLVFEWCRENLGIKDDTKWFSILHPVDDTVMLEVYIFQQAWYQAFEKRYKDDFVPNEVINGNSCQKPQFDL